MTLHTSCFAVDEIDIPDTVGLVSIPVVVDALMADDAVDAVIVDAAG